MRYQVARVAGSSFFAVALLAITARPASRHEYLALDGVAAQSFDDQHRVLCLLVWTLIIARPYLNLDPTLMPNGREYGSAIQTHHFWVQLRECGACALWSGSVRGGNPALVDPYGSLLHPLVAR